ncbi:MAG: 4Fe-4S dicluster domain-containing protein [Actinobacteria bacterium]|nr:4Fe-4S dicluster domain-containing protein [Actinomycetota bacterium]MCL6087758.1 4Fe-4S dicluster domain-containing protein [Actinomycetota bacterium]
MKLKSFLKKQNLIPFCEKLSEKFEIYLPVKDISNNISDFMEWKEYVRLTEGKSEKNSSESQVEINLTERTKKSIKSLFFPPVEKLFDFAIKKNLQHPETTDLELADSVKNIASQSTGERKKIILGIKPCDMSAVKRLDRIFLNGDKTDAHYMSRRKDTIFISIGCNTSSQGCFCTSVGGNPFDFSDSDIGMIEVSDGYAIVKVDDKSAWILEEYSQFFNEDLTNNYDDKIKQIIVSAEENLKNFLKKENIEVNDIPAVMDEYFKSEIWEKITAKCISCAACTYVCPTCTCFSISDESKELSGERYRCWDFCMNYYYNLEASGHNPRAEIYQRYRNKINCKFNYNYKRSSSFYCVGCGRCVDVCPAGMDIREIISIILKNNKNILKK